MNARQLIRVPDSMDGLRQPTLRGEPQVVFDEPRLLLPFWDTYGNLAYVRTFSWTVTS